MLFCFTSVCFLFIFHDMGFISHSCLSLKLSPTPSQNAPSVTAAQQHHHRLSGVTAPTAFRLKYYFFKNWIFKVSKNVRELQFSLSAPLYTHRPIIILNVF